MAALSALSGSDRDFASQHQDRPSDALAARRESLLTERVGLAPNREPLPDGIRTIRLPTGAAQAVRAYATFASEPNRKIGALHSQPGARCVCYDAGG